jgi:hypothetical protein|tara:strand:- start:360 stop:527 length:168 start_codon:yes stop_codon:yes gene_type:complete
MSNPAENLFNEIKQSIEEILDGVTDEEKDDILTALEEDTGDTVLTFDIAHIMENL